MPRRADTNKKRGRLSRKHGRREKIAHETGFDFEFDFDQSFWESEPKRKSKSTKK